MIPTKKGPAGLRSTAGLILGTAEQIDDEQQIDRGCAVNGQRRFLVCNEPSPLEIAKAIIPDVLALADALGWPIQCTGPNFAWYRGNANTPSLDVREDGEVWYDFVLGQGGGAIELLALVEGLGRREACRRFIEISVDVQSKMSLSQVRSAYSAACGSCSIRERQRRVADSKDHNERKKAEVRTKWSELFEFSEPDDSDLTQIIRIRRWPTFAGIGLRHAIARGLLHVIRDGVDSSFVVTDGDRVSAKRRRLDGKPWFKGAKSLCLPGSENRWPIGTAAIRNGDHAILVEGEADQLAMLCLLEIFVPEALGCTSAISLSASASIHPAAIVLIQARARRFTILGDADPVGQRAATRWRAQLTTAQFAYPIGVGAVNDVEPDCKDVSDILSLLEQRPESRDRIKSWLLSVINPPTATSTQL